MLRVGGIFRVRDLFLSCELSEVHEVIEAWLAGATLRAEEEWTRAECETYLRDEYSTFTWLFEPMLEQVRFEIQEATHRDSRIYAAYTCVRRQRYAHAVSVPRKEPVK
jgi:hypothetical protein